MSQASTEEQALEAVASWLPKSIDSVVEELTKSGPLPGIVKVSGPELRDYWASLSELDKVKRWMGMAEADKAELRKVWGTERRLSK